MHFEINLIFREVHAKRSHVPVYSDCLCIDKEKQLSLAQNSILATLWQTSLSENMQNANSFAQFCTK